MKGEEVRKVRKAQLGRTPNADAVRPRSRRRWVVEVSPPAPLAEQGVQQEWETGGLHEQMRFVGPGLRDPQQPS